MPGSFIEQRWGGGWCSEEVKYKKRDISLAEHLLEWPVLPKGCANFFSGLGQTVSL